MTIGTLITVAVLAAQAATSAHKVAAAGAASVRPTATVQPSGTASPGVSTAAAVPNPTSLPTASGSGSRIVYSLSGKRVWIVFSNGAVAQTFPVVPGTITPSTGSYQVSGKITAETGTDGTPVQYVVLFSAPTANGQGPVFGFDAVSGVTGLPPAPTSPTGGIRMSQVDAEAIWNFASTGTTVVVVH